LIKMRVIGGKVTNILDKNAIQLHRTGVGPAVVLLHCLGVDRHLWDFAVTDLSDKFTLLTYDLPGHGETPVPRKTYGIEHLSEQLAASMEREEIARAHIVGISLGGLVAQHFAASYRDRVGRLVLIDTTPRYTDELRQMWAERAETARTSGVGSLTEGLLHIWFTPGFLGQDPPAVRYVRELFKRTSGEGYALACEALASADLRPLAQRIETSTLLLCGDQDIPSFLEAARWLARNIEKARLEWLAPARHASILEQPEAFLRIIRQFLS
jgi:3-oxoadipate enol-lactonase